MLSHSCLHFIERSGIWKRLSKEYFPGLISEDLNDEIAFRDVWKKREVLIREKLASLPTEFNVRVSFRNSTETALQICWVDFQG